MSSCVSDVNSISPSNNSKLFCEFPAQIAHFQARTLEKDMFFILVIMQVMFITLAAPTVDLP